MPSKSKSQQRFFGMVDAYKKGELKNPGSKIKKAAKGMSMDDVKDFAETKHKGLPEKVEENMNKQIIRMTESDLHRIVKESVRKILRESMYDPYEGGDFYILYSPEVGFLEDDTYESYEAAQEALMEYGDAYEDLTVYFVPEGDLSNAEEA